MLLAAYNFDSGPVVLDRSGNGRHLDLTGSNGVLTADGDGHGGGRALTKAGAVMPAITPAFGQTERRTVMCWVRGSGVVWWVRWPIPALGDSGGWGLLNLSGTITVQARSATTLARAQAAAPADQATAWHHYAGTYDGTDVRLFVDGALAASAALAGPLRTDANRVDLAEWTTSDTRMDDLRIYDEALTGSQITALMNTPVTDSPVGSQVAHFH